MSGANQNSSGQIIRLPVVIKRALLLLPVCRLCAAPGLISATLFVLYAAIFLLTTPLAATCFQVEKIFRGLNRMVLNTSKII